MRKHITYTHHGKGYGEIYLNRPEKHNAISKQMTKEFMECLLEAKKDKIKFLVITAAGEKMFCAGGDLNTLHGHLSSDEAFSALYPMKEVLFEIVSFPVPVICLLNGGALGGGCEIATACDIRMAKETSKFGFVQSKLGIIPGWGGGAILYEKVDPTFALQWLIDGAIFDSHYLKERGWIQQIIDQKEWTNREKILEPYVSKSYDQMKILKRQFKKKISSIGLSSLMTEEVRNCSVLWESEEHVQAVNEFLSR